MANIHSSVVNGNRHLTDPAILVMGMAVTTPGQRLKLFAKTRYSTVKGFAEAISESQQSVSKWISGVSPSMEILQKFQQAGLDLNWYATGEGYMDREPAPNAVRLENDLTGKQLYTAEQVIEMIRERLQPQERAGNSPS